MKKVLFTMVIAAGLYACGGGEEKQKQSPSAMQQLKRLQLL